MSQSVIAERYAEALFQRGQEIEIVDQLYEELQTVREVFLNNERLHIFLKHPRIHREDKYELLDTSFQSIHDDILNTLKLLVDRKRTEIIPSMIEHFTRLVNEERGIAMAKVYSVYELSQDEKQALSDRFAKRLQKKAIEIENIIDPTLIGGLRIQVGNTVYDGSIQRKLEKLKQNIAIASE